MKRLGLVVVFATSLSIAQAATPQVTQVSKTHVRRIYVDELHFPSNPDWDGFVRSKLISSLVQECGSGCSVVEAVGPTGNNGEDTADAILTGNMLVQCPDNHHCKIQGAMRLVDKEGTVVWASTIYSSPLARSASSSFADNTAKKLSAFLVKAQ